MQNTFQPFFPVLLSGQVVSIESCKALGSFLRTCLNEGHKKVIIDWSQVNEITGSLAGFIIVANGQFKKKGGEIILANPTDSVADIFKVVGLGSMVVRSVQIPAKDGYRALIAEDDQYLQELTAEYLRELGFKTFTAENGRAALVEFDLLHQQIDLIVSDIEMPKLDGLGFFKQVNKVDPTFPFIVTTGYTDSEKIKEFKTIRPQIPILYKPYLPSELEEAIAQFVTPLPYHQ